MKKEYDKADYEFLRHEPCPKCGSTNNVGVWRHKSTGGETKYCNSDGCDYKITTASLYKSSQPGTALPDSWLQAKGLTAEVCKQYRITRDGKVIYFGVASPDGKLRGIAGRNYGVPKHNDKHFFWKQSSNLLYGMDSCTGQDRLIITSGFWDAPSAKLLTGWNAVSLPNGDKSAKNSITDNYQWLKRFKRIYICFDNDESGQAAAVTSMEILGYRARNIILPDFTVLTGDEAVSVKDANDYIRHGLHKEFQQACMSADARLTPYVFGSEADEQYAEYKLRGDSQGWSTGIPELDALLTLRQNEFTILFGAPGRGKSTFARFLVAMSQVRPFYISLEDPVWICLDNLSKVLLHEHTPYDAFGTCTLTKDELLKRSRAIRERVSLAHLDSCTPEVLADAIECAYVQYGCQFIVLDHITWLLNMEDDQRATAVKYMNVIADLCKRLPIHIFVVSHNKPLDYSVQKQHSKKFMSDWEEYVDPTARDAQWSSVFEQVAWNILGWKNPSDANTPAKLHVLKNRTGGMKKLGVVLLYFDDEYNTYMGVKEYARKTQERQRQISDRRDSSHLSLNAGENHTGDLQSVDSSERVEVSRIPSQNGDINNECSGTSGIGADETKDDSANTDNARATDISSEVQPVSMESGLLLSREREHNRVQRGDGYLISPCCRDLQGATSRLVEKISDSLSETGLTNPTTTKLDLPGVGRTTRARVGILRPDKGTKNGDDTVRLAQIDFSAVPGGERWNL